MAGQRLGADTPVHMSPSRRARVVASSITAAMNLGYLTVLREAAGYVGGYLVTNSWGRPLEFRLSTSVQPSRVQLILYGGTLEPYICGELVGKALVEKTATHAQLIVTDCESALELRQRLDTPVVLLKDDPLKSDQPGNGLLGRRGPVFCHPRFPQDAEAASEFLGRLDPAYNLAEPFARIREALSEARKMGAMSRG